VKTTYDAKGDLLVATADNTYSKLTVGANGTVPVADSSQSTGIRWGSAGGGGATVLWVGEGADAPAKSVEFGNLVYLFEDGLTQNLYGIVRVPQNYTAGNPIKVRVYGYHQAAAATQLLSAQSTYIPSGTAFDSTTNQRTTTNTAQSAASKVTAEHVLDITDSTGNINGVAVAAGSLIKVKIFRGTDTSTSDISMLPSSTEVTFS
jgi:hypothetical protein